MESLSFFQVTPGSGGPRVAVGSISAKEVESETPKHPRLRIYAAERPGAVGVSVKALEFASQLVLLITQPGSSVRSEIEHIVPKSGRRFFRAPVADFNLIVTDTFGSWLAEFRDDAVLLEMDGSTDELIKLLDAYRDDRSAAAQAAQAATQAPPATTIGYNPREGAKHLRDRLLARGWRDGRAVGDLLGYANEKNPAQHAYRLRTAGELFGVWSPQGRYVHPDFQFDQGAIRPRVHELLSLLPKRSDDGGWGNAIWLHSPHPRLDDKEPAEVFETEPQRVIDLAKEEFTRDKNGGW